MITIPHHSKPERYDVYFSFISRVWKVGNLTASALHGVLRANYRDRTAEPRPKTYLGRFSHVVDETLKEGGVIISKI